MSGRSATKRRRLSPTSLLDVGLTGRHPLQYFDAFGVLALQSVVDGLHLLDVCHCGLGTTGGQRKEEINGETGRESENRR